MSHPPANRLRPNLLVRARNYALALARHAAGGGAVADAATVERRYRICAECDRFDGSGCLECGCPVNQTEGPLRNKIAMASEACPKGKWSAVTERSEPKRPRLTVGMAMWRDFDGPWATISSLISELQPYAGNLGALDIEDVEILVVDNCPEFPDRSKEPHARETPSERIRNMCARIPGAKYVPYNERQGTAAPRDQVFAEARGEVVLCVDSHVILVPFATRHLLWFFEHNPDFHGLVQGPLMQESGEVWTHMEPVWDDGMFGKWATAAESDYSDLVQGPIEIPMHGLGLFACRKADWLGFSPYHTEFGGEEGYIHDKFHRAGHKTICLPALKWFHRWNDGHAPYPSSVRQRIKNYLIGRLELGQTCDDVIHWFYGRPGDARDPQELRDILGEIDREIAVEHWNAWSRQTERLYGTLQRAAQLARGETPGCRRFEPAGGAVVK